MILPSFNVEKSFEYKNIAVMILFTIMKSSD